MENHPSRNWKWNPINFVLRQCYCEQYPNETSICIQSVYCNHALSSNHQNIYKNHRQVKWNGGEGKETRERDTEQHIKRE